MLAHRDGGPGRPRDLTWAEGLLFFSAESAALDRELWVSDGTVVGARRVVDILPGSDSSSPQGLTAAGDRIFFAADNGSSGLEPWVTDGTPRGTRRLGDIEPGVGSSSPQDFFVAQDLVLFSAFTSQRGRELWAIPAPWLSDLFADGFETSDTSSWSGAVP